MKELQQILAAWRASSDKRGALATVASVDGSAYRKPGARMLILEGGRTIGSVSGGCLESDVALRAKRVMETGRPELSVYDTTRDDDILFGVGLGCQGIVRIFVEPLVGDAPEALAWPETVIRSREPGVLATVVAAEAGADLGAGARLLLHASGAASGNTSLLPLATEALAAGQSLTRAVEIGGGKATVFAEYLRAPLPLTIFGAGDDAQPLVRLAREMGWHVTVADHRAAFATPERFPDADAVLLTRDHAVPETLTFAPNAAVVVMTHHYLRDRDILQSLVNCPLSYLGILGPARRTQRLLHELRDMGVALAPEWLARLHAPVGLDIGAETPEQIALAITAEIQAVATHRNGGFLRERARLPRKSAACLELA